MWKLLAVLYLTATTVTCWDEFIMDVENQASLVGHDATFHCAVFKQSQQSEPVNITEPLSIQWTFTPLNSSTSRSIYNATWISTDDQSGISANMSKYYSSARGDVAVKSVTSSDAGTYTCKVKDTTASKSAQLFVLAVKSPNCSKDNPGPVYYEGSNASLICTVRYHGNEPPAVKWKAPHGHKELKSPTVQQEKIRGLIQSSVLIRLQHLIDGLMYTCYVDFPNVSQTFSCQTMFKPFSILYPAYITVLQTYPRSTATDHQAQVGTNLTFYCHAHGNPSVTWQWLFTPEDSEHAILLGCRNMACTVRNTSRSNSGRYTCNVRNVINGTEHHDSRSIDIQVVDDPNAYVVVNSKAQSTTLAPVLHKPAGFSPYAIGAIVSASLAVVLIVVFIILAMKMRSRERRIHERLTRMHDENLDDQEVELLDENIQPISSDLPNEYGDLKQQWEIARKDVRLVDLVAKGTYVEVWRGRMRKYPYRNEIVKVAIKRIVSEATEKEKKFFLAELEVMKALQSHLNIVPLLGCYTANEPWLMMYEFAGEGSLYQYIQRRRPGDLHVEISSGGQESVSLKNQITAHKLLALAAQVVSGIEHLNKFKLINYRLKASSVLVFKGGVCKLSGFGFPQDITDRNLYETNSAPIRWMAPESLLDSVYNIKTDVWSYGVLLWEVVHFGQLPYPDMGPHEVAEKVQNGYRMSQPSHCSEDLYNLMLMCWHENPDNRPSFGDVLQVLTHLADAAAAHINLENLPDSLSSLDQADATAVGT